MAFSNTAHAVQNICLDYLKADERVFVNYNNPASMRLKTVAGYFRARQDVGASRRYSHEAVAHILLSNELIPRGGKVHIIGSGLNVQEWIKFLVLRPDLEIHVSEPYYASAATDSARPNTSDRMHNLVKMYLEELDPDKDFPNEPMLAIYFKKFKEKCLSGEKCLDVPNLHFHRNAASAYEGRNFDFVLSSFPWFRSSVDLHDTYDPVQAIHSSLKPGGLAWVITDSVGPDGFLKYNTREQSPYPAENILSLPVNDPVALFSKPNDLTFTNHAQEAYLIEKSAAP